MNQTASNLADGNELQELYETKDLQAEGSRNKEVIDKRRVGYGKVHFPSGDGRGLSVIVYN